MSFKPDIAHAICVNLAQQMTEAILERTTPQNRILFKQRANAKLNLSITINNLPNIQNIPSFQDKLKLLVIFLTNFDKTKTAKTKYKKQTRKEFGWHLWQCLLSDDMMDIVITTMDWVCLMYKYDNVEYDYLAASEFVRKKLLLIPRTKMSKQKKVVFKNNITPHTIHSATTELAKLCHL